jgi:hypothetical protein
VFGPRPRGPATLRVRAAHGTGARTAWPRRVAPATWWRGSTASSARGGDAATLPVKGEGGGAMGSLTGAQARRERAVQR